MEGFVKYGGIKFSNNVPAKEINLFVKNLLPEKKDSLFEVIKELERAGMITIHEGDFSTIDQDLQPWMD